MEITPAFCIVKSLKMVTNIGIMQIPDHFDNVELDEFVVMPNHIHGIIVICGEYTAGRDVAKPSVETRLIASLPEHKNRFCPLKKGSLSTIIGSYKSAVTRLIRKHHNSKFAWKSRFYDHAIRNENALEKIVNYTHQNPKNWKQDQNIQNKDKHFLGNKIKGIK
jgi:REP element-mobilizing transposase RayT